MDPRLKKWLNGPWLYSRRGGYVYAEGDEGGKVLDVRGWGFLTGSGYGALGLSEKEASELQNAMGQRLASLPELEKQLAEARLALTDSNALFSAMLLETRPVVEIEAQIRENRVVLSKGGS